MNKATFSTSINSCKNHYELTSTNYGNGYYIAGFVDGEGSFNVSFRKRDDYLLGWKITPVFNVSQKEKTILTLIENHMGCGTIRFRNDNVWVFEVNKKADLVSKVIPFFQEYGFLSDKKQKDFSRFIKLVHIVYMRNKSRTIEDLKDILELLHEQSTGSNNRKFKLSEILERAFLFYNKNKNKIESLNA